MNSEIFNLSLLMHRLGSGGGFLSFFYFYFFKFRDGPVVFLFHNTFHILNIQELWKG